MNIYYDPRLIMDTVAPPPPPPPKDISGGERELRTTYLKPFNRACVEALSIMTAYSSYDGIPAIANTRMSLHCILSS